VNVGSATFIAEGVYYRHLQQRSPASKWPGNSQSPRPAERSYAAAVFRGSSYVVTEYVAICGVENQSLEHQQKCERTMMSPESFAQGTSVMQLSC
jgi:hypothetical protein